MSELAVIPLARIRPNLNQVRRTFHRIDELARSIAQYGLLQNLVVLYARGENGAQPMVELRRAVSALLRRMADGYGRDRWPMSAYLFWRQQRFRRRDRPRRGLPSLDD